MRRMASKKFDKGSIEWKCFSEFWIFAQRFWEPDGTDEYWHEAVEASADFVEKYSEIESEFAREIMVAMMKTLDRRLKEHRERESPD